jgi:hypothetical protein
MEFVLAPDGQYVKHGSNIFKRLKTRQVPYKLNDEQKTRRKLYMREYRAKSKTPTPKCETSKSDVCASDEKTNL